MNRRRKVMNGAGIYECPDWCLGHAMKPSGQELASRQHVGDWVQVLAGAGPDGMTEAWARPVRDWLNWDLNQVPGDEYTGIEFYLTPITEYAALSGDAVTQLRIGLEYVQDMAATPNDWVWAYDGADADMAADELDRIEAEAAA